VLLQTERERPSDLAGRTYNEQYTRLAKPPNARLLHTIHKGIHVSKQRAQNLLLLLRALDTLAQECIIALRRRDILRHGRIPTDRLGFSLDGGTSLDWALLRGIGSPKLCSRCPDAKSRHLYFLGGCWDEVEVAS